VSEKELGVGADDAVIWTRKGTHLQHSEGLPDGYEPPSASLSQAAAKPSTPAPDAEPSVGADG
jgi:hypothetical protein